MTKTIALFLRPGSRWDKSKPVREQAFWDEHARFVDDLFDRGLIMLAGRFAPEGTGALVILNVDSVAEAKAICKRSMGASRHTHHRRCPGMENLSRRARAS